MTLSFSLLYSCKKKIEFELGREGGGKSDFLRRE
jgi:hypothetical protein